MEKYYLIFTEPNGLQSTFIFEEDEKEICKNIAKELDKSKKYKNINILVAPEYKTPSLKEMKGKN